MILQAGLPLGSNREDHDMTISESIISAYQADDAFELAIHAAGYKSRWHWNQHIDPGPEALRAAYRAKVTADNAMHLAFMLSRKQES
jgi:hypothetical protein